MDLIVTSEFENISGLYIAKEGEHSQMRVMFGKFLDLNGFRTGHCADAMINGKNAFLLDNSDPKEMFEFALYKGWLHLDLIEDVIFLVAEAPVADFRRKCEGILNQKFRKYRDANKYINDQGIFKIKNFPTLEDRSFIMPIDLRTVKEVENNSYIVLNWDIIEGKY